MPRLIFLGGVAALSLVASLSGQQPGPSTASTGATQIEPRPLTNDDIIKMAKAGLSEALIITTIRQARNPKFLLAPEALIELKAAGVSENILAVMLDPKAEVLYSAPAPTPATPDRPPIDTTR